MATISFTEIGILLDAQYELETCIRKAGRWSVSLEKKVIAAQEVLARLSDRDAMSCDTCGCVLDDVAIEAGRTQCFECYCEHQG
jgi:hypothetical protein